MHAVMKNISSIFSSNSETSASELLNNLEEMIVVHGSQLGWCEFVMKIQHIQRVLMFIKISMARKHSSKKSLHIYHIDVNDQQL